jgi:hypothetical protein
VGINIISISDVHIGLSTLPPTYIPDNLRKYLYPHLNDELDILFIVGDFWETILDFNGLAGYEASCVISEIIELSIRHNFIIRILQGTYTHDRRQNQFFKTNKKLLETDSDRVKVFEKIDIEVIDKYGISVLYIPDDLPTKNVMENILEIKNTNNIGKFDFILNHGYFKHILPLGIPHEPPNTLDADVVSGMVKATVLNGHVHTSCVYKKVINNGSFDRLRHNEEESKGFFKLHYIPESEKLTYEFIENKDAVIFKTIGLAKYNDDIDTAINVVRDKVATICDNTDRKVFIRLVSDSDIIRQGVTRYLVTRFNNVVVSSKKHTKKKNTYEDETIYEVGELPKITEENICDMVVAFTKDEKVPLSKEYVESKLR